MSSSGQNISLLQYRIDSVVNHCSTLVGASLYKDPARETVLIPSVQRISQNHHDLRRWYGRDIFN